MQFLRSADKALNVRYLCGECRVPECGQRRGHSRHELSTVCPGFPEVDVWRHPECGGEVHRSRCAAD